MNITFKFISRSILIATCAVFSVHIAQAQTPPTWQEVVDCSRPGDLPQGVDQTLCRNIKDAYVFKQISKCSQEEDVEDFQLLGTILSSLGITDAQYRKVKFPIEYTVRCEENKEAITQCLQEDYFNSNSALCGRIFGNGSNNLAEYKTKLQDLAREASSIRQEELKEAECALSPFSKKCFEMIVTGILSWTIVPISAGFLKLCAYLFEIIIYVGIIIFSSYAGGEWLTNIWGTVRDLLNIFVIFILLYSAIKVIVGRGDEIRKLIAGVILFGVMTNFSLFLTKAAVDLSNVVALEFYQQMRNVNLTNSSFVETFQNGIGATIVQQTGLSKYYDYRAANDQVEGGGNVATEVTSSILLLLAMCLTFIAVGFVFLQAAFMFLARIVSLILLMIFSPLMFAGGVFTPLQKWIGGWHKEFIGQTLLAPIFMILLYVALTILGNLNEVISAQLVDSSLVGRIALIVLTTGLTIFGFSAALNQAKEYAGSIGGKAAQFGSKVGAFAFGKSASFALDRTAGGVAKGLQATLGRVPGLKNFSYDIRNVKAVQTASKAVSSGVSKALSAASGGVVPDLQVSAGPGIKNKEGRLADQREVAKKKAEGIQKKQDEKIENEFKRIDGEVKKYQLTDRKITDVNGNVITRGPTEDDDAWGKKVKQVNVDHKKAAEAKKQDYLARMSTSSRARTEAGKAAFRAKKAAEEKLDKSQKAARDNEKHKADLKLYTKTLVDKLASDAGARLDPPLNTVVLTKTKDDIEKMSSGEIVEQWKSVQDQIEIIQETFLAQNKAVLKDPTHPDFGTKLQQKKAIAGQLKYASGARNEIPSLTKKIEDFDKR